MAASSLSGISTNVSLKVTATGDKMKGTVALSKIQPSHQNEVFAVKKLANH